MSYAQIIDAFCVSPLEKLDGEVKVAAKLYRKREITLKTAVDYMRYLNILKE